MSPEYIIPLVFVAHVGITFSDSFSPLSLNTE